MPGYALGLGLADLNLIFSVDINIANTPDIERPDHLEACSDPHPSWVQGDGLLALL
jgi:hypothetical protein